MAARKSPTEKNLSKKDEGGEEKEVSDVLPVTSSDLSLPLDQDPSTLSSDIQQKDQKTEVETASQSDVNTRSTGQQLQTLLSVNQTPEEERSRLDIKGTESSKKDKLGPFPL